MSCSFWRATAGDRFGDGLLRTAVAFRKDAFSGAGTQSLH